MAADITRSGNPLRRRRLRVNFATRLLIGGMMISLGLIVVLSSFLLVSRSSQTSTVAQSNAENRARVVRALIQHITAPQARAAAAGVAGLAALETALTAPDPAAAVAQMFLDHPGVAVPLANENLIIFGSNGLVLHTTEPAANPHLSVGQSGVRAALAGRTNEGVEVLGVTDIVYDLAVPVRASSASPVLGVVVYSIPLNVPLNDLAPAVGYPTAMFSDSSPHSLLRVSARGLTKVPLPAQLTAAFPSGTDLIDATYAVPGVGDVEASFVALADPLAAGDRAHRPGAAYVGVEVPLQPFFENQTKDEVTVVLFGITAAFLVALSVILFVNRFVRRPVSRLGDGVARIAGGDYSSDIPVESDDELGLLAASVNTMRVRIASYIRHIDGAIARLGEVSHALTTTTGGIEKLEVAVCAAAAAITGEGAVAHLLHRQDDDLINRTQTEGDGPQVEISPAMIRSVLAGAPTRVTVDGGNRLCVPMFYQGAVTGALLVIAAENPSEADEQALVALANNAAVAIENTRLFEQEKETVARLRQLDAMKSDFLSTAQHELRTPVTAIMGQLDLIKIAWSQWDDTMKLGIIGDIEVSTRLLGELLESIIDFSLLSAEHLKLQEEAVDVLPVVTEAVDEVAHHFVDGMPVELNIDVAAGLAVSADRVRFRQVIRCVLDNAVKFTDPGGHVGITATTESDAGLCVIEVTDDGMGIEGEALPHIFERFFQANNTRTRTFGGLGMGLALAAELCAAQNATISVTSTPGQGSRFTIRWPAAGRGAGDPPRPPIDAFHMTLG